MRNHPINLKWTMSKIINETIKRAIRQRLEILLEDQQKQYRHWIENNKHKMNVSRQDQVERKFNKIIQAMKIVIYYLTPYFERMDDEPTFVIKKKKE